MIFWFKKICSFNLLESIKVNWKGGRTCKDDGKKLVFDFGLERRTWQDTAEKSSDWNWGMTGTVIWETGIEIIKWKYGSV